MQPAPQPSNLITQLMQRAAPEAGKPARHAEGAKRFPPALTGGESPSAVDTNAKVDWLTCTWLPDHDEHIESTIQHLLCDLLTVPVHGLSAPGMFGYQQGCRYFVKLDDGKEHHIARVDYGGTHHKMRARLDLSGAGCARVKSWRHIQDWISQQFDPSLTRVDLAVDCLNGEFTVEHAVDWYKSGDFNAGGRMPRHSTPGDWLLDTPVHGRTLEVGRRENGKMLRAYEKGRQLGDPSSSWTRFEVEIRNIDRVLPMDILTRCDHYFVGAYKCLQRLLAVAGERIKTHQAEGEISLEKLTESARTSYGCLINVMRLTLTADEVIESLSRPGVPQRLEKASLAGLLNQSASSMRFQP